MGIVALVLLAWQAARIPLEGSVETSLAHARSVRGLEESLGLDVEGPFIRFASTAPYDGILEWMYTGIHTPALFGFMAAACVYAPERYARLRTIFVVSFLPALLAIGLFPLAPPHWISELGFGPAPEQGELAGSIETLMHNSTAAIASQHFGFAAFIAAAALWLAPARPSPGPRWRIPPWSSSSSSEPATTTFSIASSVCSRSRSRRPSRRLLHGRSAPSRRARRAYRPQRLPGLRDDRLGARLPAVDLTGRLAKRRRRARPRGRDRGGAGTTLEREGAARREQLDVASFRIAFPDLQP